MRPALLGAASAAAAAAAVLVWIASGGPRTCRPAVADDGVSLGVEPRADHVLVADAQVELAQAAPVFLEYGNDQVGWLRSPTSQAAKSHRVPLVRLRAETAYQVRAFSVDAAGCPATQTSAQLTTAQLPPQLRRLAAESTGHPSFPLTIMDLKPPVGTSHWLVAVDEDGRPVWYYAIPEELGEGGQTALVKLTNGNWLYLARRFGVEEISPDALLVRRIRLASPPASRIHHDIIELPDGRMLFIGQDRRVVDDTRNGGPQNLRMRGDTLHILDLESGAEEQVWNSFDALDPTDRSAHPDSVDDDREQDSLDWTHANGVSLAPGGNILLTLRHLHQVISLSPDFRAIEWKLGGPGSSFEFPDPTDRFWAPHAAVELPGGNILMFDNGGSRPEGEYSRALELRLDFQSMTARKVWEYRHQPDVFSDRVSNAIRLPDGNTLVNFGYRTEDPAEPLLLVEAKADGTPMWRQLMRFRGNRTSRYRAYPLASLAGEASVRPTAFTPR